MIWKAIGQSVIGTSHIQSGKGCEDSIVYEVIAVDDDEILICFVSDGAGSAKFAAEASETSVQIAAQFTKDNLKAEIKLTEDLLIQIVEKVYDTLEGLALAAGEPKNEFSCTLLGFILLPNTAGFLQIGDGAMIRNDGSDHFTHIFWPHNGEYQNSTAFLIDSPTFPHLKTKIIEERITEVSVFTDGIQLLALTTETETVYQPFFEKLFPALRKAGGPEHISVLNGKLIDYLSGSVINSRTDDDKTLLLATRNK